MEGGGWEVAGNAFSQFPRNRPSVLRNTHKDSVTAMKNQIGSSILCVPSWVVPGTYAENLRFLETKTEIQCVELLFYLYDDEIKLQLDFEWDEILSYRKRFVFTAHLPKLLLPAHEELVARLAPLVRHYIVHPAVEGPAAQAKLLRKWAERYGSKFLAENTEVGLLEALFPHLGVARRAKPGGFFSKLWGSHR